MLLNYLDIQEVLGQNWGTLVDGLTGAVEHTTQHVFGYGRTQNVTGELAHRVLGVDTRGAFEHLDDGLGTADFQHLTGADGAIVQAELDDFGKLRELDLIQDNQGTVHTGYGLIGCGRFVREGGN